MPSRPMSRCGKLEMGNESSELEGGLHWDDTQCGELGCGHCLEGTEGIEKGNDPPAERGPGQDIGPGEG